MLSLANVVVFVVLVHTVPNVKVVDVVDIRMVDYVLDAIKEALVGASRGGWVLLRARDDVAYGNDHYCSAQYPQCRWRSC